MTTIVYQGREWKEIGTRGTDLADHFPAPKIRIADEEKDKPDLVSLLQLPQNVSETQTSCTSFCNLSKVEFESEKRLPKAEILELDGAQSPWQSLGSWSLSLSRR